MKDELGKQLEQILTVLFTEPENLPRLLEGTDKEVLIQCFTDILNRYANDVNSSTLRELITMMMAGYEFKVIGTKLGYNGKTSQGSPCEVKPKNIRGDSGDKLNGGGSFNDFTYERLDKYQKDGLMVLVSGFVDARLIYVLEFPFSYPEFVQRLQEQLERHFARGKRVPGQYLRGANFSFNNYKNCPQLKVIYKEPHISSFEKSLTKDLFHLLEG
jgi:hypothetical protein